MALKTNKRRIGPDNKTGEKNEEVFSFNSPWSG